MNFRYLECSASIYSSVTFCFTSAATAYDFLFTRQLQMGHLSVVHNLRTINISCRLGLKYIFDLTTWDSLLAALPTLTSIATIHCWLDSPGLDDKVQFGSTSRPFRHVTAELARKLTVDFPVDEICGLQWEESPPQSFRMRQRPCESYDYLDLGYSLFD